MWQSKYFPTPTLQIVPGEYPQMWPVVGTSFLGTPRVCPHVGVGNTPVLGYPRVLPHVVAETGFNSPGYPRGYLPGIPRVPSAVWGWGSILTATLRRLHLKVETRHSDNVA